MSNSETYNNLGVHWEGGCNCTIFTPSLIICSPLHHSRDCMVSSINSCSLKRKKEKKKKGGKKRPLDYKS